MIALQRPDFVTGTGILQPLTTDDFVGASVAVTRAFTQPVVELPGGEPFVPAADVARVAKQVGTLFGQGAPAVDAKLPVGVARVVAGNPPQTPGIEYALWNAATRYAEGRYTTLIDQRGRRADVRPDYRRCC